MSTEPKKQNDTDPIEANEKVSKAGSGIQNSTNEKTKSSVAKSSIATQETGNTTQLTENPNDSFVEQETANEKPASGPNKIEAKKDMKQEPASSSKITSNDKKEKKKILKANSKFGSKLRSLLLFILLVFVPWVLIIGYVMTVAHPRYVSKSGVVVKQVSDTTTGTGSGIGALLGVNSTSVEDTKYLTEYILSNDMIKKLDNEFDFKKAYYIDGSDVIYELTKNATQEELLEYFKKRVHIDLDEQTNVLTVTTEAFDPEYALELNKAILLESEQFVNQISQQIATDQLQYSHEQLIDSQVRLDKAKSKLLSYQNKNRVFDPQTNAKMVNQLIGNLQAQLSSLRTEEGQLLSYLNPEAPQVVSIRNQIKSVQNQIQAEQSKLTSPSNNAKLNEQAVEFETIKQEVEFATELYKISLSSLEKSRLEAFRKMKNLIVISAPYKAEEALYPRVYYIIFTSLAFLLIFYGFVRLVMAVIKDHSS